MGATGSEQHTLNCGKPGDFPGGSGVKSPSFQSGDAGLSLVGELRSHMPFGIAKKEEEEEEEEVLVSGAPKCSGL